MKNQSTLTDEHGRSNAVGAWIAQERPFDFIYQERHGQLVLAF